MTRPDPGSQKARTPKIYNLQIYHSLLTSDEKSNQEFSAPRLRENDRNSSFSRNYLMVKGVCTRLFQITRCEACYGCAGFSVTSEPGLPGMSRRLRHRELESLEYLSG